MRGEVKFVPDQMDTPKSIRWKLDGPLVLPGLRSLSGSEASTGTFQCDWMDWYKHEAMMVNRWRSLHFSNGFFQSELAYRPRGAMLMTSTTFQVELKFIRSSTEDRMCYMSPMMS